MGQQYSNPGNPYESSIGAPASSGGERKTGVVDNGDTRQAQTSAAWRTLAAMTGPAAGHSELGPGDRQTSRQRTEVEVSRMSIRAAIDSFIENCLSQASDDKTLDEPRICNVITSIEATEKITCISSNLTHAESPKDLITKSVDIETSSESETALSLDIKHRKDVKIEENDTKNCSDKATEEIEMLDVKDVSIISDDANSQQEKVKEELSEDGDEKTKFKQSPKRDSTEASRGTPDKQESRPASTERQSFSAFLHGRLKNEKLTGLPFSKEIPYDQQMDGQIFMWEIPKKAAAPIDSSNPSDVPDGSSLLTLGPVRLQTLIDKVLDSSLNSHFPASSPSHKQQAEKSETTQKANYNPSPKSCEPETSMKEKQEQSLTTTSSGTAATTTTGSSDPPEKEKRFCFKDHIEKVLLESFLSYEEEERQESLKAENANQQQASSKESLDGAKAKYEGSGRMIKGTENETLNGKKDGTISVQDIVDQVISQTEKISRMLTPSSTRDFRSLPGHSTTAIPSSISPNHDKSGPRCSMSSQSKALLEAQRHTVQKEHQSSTALGRKRGRPQLNPVINISTSELPKVSKSGYAIDRPQAVRVSQASTLVNDHCQLGPLQMTCTSQSPIHYGAHGSMSSLKTSQSLSPSAAMLYQQGRLLTHKLPETTSSSRVPISSSSSHTHPLSSLHQQYRGQQLSNQAHQPLNHHHHHNYQPSPGSQTFSPTMPPLLALADHIKENLSSGTLSGHQMPHIPSKSCSCQTCVSNLAQGNPVPHHHQRHHHPDQIHVHAPSSHHTTSSHQPESPTLKTDNLVPVLAPPVSDPLSQNLVPALKVTHLQKREPVLISSPRETIQNHQNDFEEKTFSKGHQQQVHSSLAKPAIAATRLCEINYQVTKERVHFDYPQDKGDSQARYTGETSPGQKAYVIHETEQPLDLSVKPSSTHRQDLRADSVHSQDMRPGYDHRGGVTGQDHWFLDKERQSSFDLSSKARGQYVENEQQGLSGYHLHQLENSVDKLLPHGQQPTVAAYAQHTYLPQQGQKTNVLSAPNIPWADRRGGSQQDLTEHPQTLRQSQLQKIVTPSPSSGHYQSRSPSLIINCSLSKASDFSHHLTPFQNHENLPHFTGVTSQGGYDLSPNPGPDQKITSAPSLGSSSGSSTPGGHPQDSPSLEDQDGQKFNVSRHEPIQNIIGSHLPNDILYLICRLCRQTYGSPYGFRKHFRNQHGFEPKASHTIVQTISATKTAMAHTGPMDPNDESLPPQSPQDDMVLHNVPQLHNQSFKPQPSLSLNINSETEDPKPDSKRETSENTKFLECPECGQAFQLNDFGSYKRHCRQHGHQRSSGPFICHECQRSFLDSDALREHLLTHSSFSPSLCGICHTFFSSPSYLSEHFQAAHGQVINTEGREKEPAHPDSRESSRSADYIQNSRHSSTEIKRSSSFCGQSSLASSATTRGLNISLPQHSAPPTAPILNTAVSPMNNKPPDLKSNSSMLFRNSHMLIVHTPKGLAVEKQPADAVVTTAIPDSSYDEAKFQVDTAQTGSSISEKTATETQIPRTANEAKGEKHLYPAIESKTEKIITSISKDIELSDDIKSHNKNDTKSNSSLTSSNILSSSSQTTSGDGTSDSFYRHKKYSQSRKRANHSDVDDESRMKVKKSEEMNFTHKQSQFSVCSVGVTLQNCESSSSHSDDSSSKSKFDELNKGEVKPFNKSRISGKGGAEEDPGKDGQCVRGTSSGDAGNKFKWDRQTRSQTGKLSQNITNTS